VIRVKISFIKVIITPPARVRKPLERWEESWLSEERPTWTKPQHNRAVSTYLLTHFSKLTHI